MFLSILKIYIDFTRKYILYIFLCIDACISFSCFHLDFQKNKGVLGNLIFSIELYLQGYSKCCQSRWFSDYFHSNLYIWGKGGGCWLSFVKILAPAPSPSHNKCIIFVGFIFSRISGIKEFSCKSENLKKLIKI